MLLCFNGIEKLDIHDSREQYFNGIEKLDIHVSREQIKEAIVF